MNTEWKAKWIAALRSGEYMQGQEQLRFQSDAGPKYCCLGVLAHITGCRYDAKADTLPAEIATLVGLPRYRPRPEHSAPFAVSRNPQAKMARMNDNGKSFAEIADWIEEHL